MKYAFINEQRHHHSVPRLCEVIGVSRSGYYDWKNRKPSVRAQTNQRLWEKIQNLYTQHHERYGSPRLHAALRRMGEDVSKGRVERLMKQHGLQAIRSRRHKRVWYQREQQQPALNVLNRMFHADRPNHKWVTDITFIPTREGFLYLAMVLDLYSRAIVGWSMSQRINGELVMAALQMAIEQRGRPKGVLVHSDQGSQYTAESYRQLLKQFHMECSMSRKGVCYDNAVAESFFHTLKEELVKDSVYRTRTEAKQSIFKYIELYYNRQRLHSTLGYHAPFEYEKMQVVA